MSFVKDLRLAARRLRASPLVTTLSVLSLGLGVAGAAVLFSVVESTVLDPLPFREVDRLVSIYQHVPTDGSTRGQLRPSDGDLVELLASEHGFQALAAIRSTGSPLRLGDRVLTPLMREASRDYFDLLGVAPRLGRTFAEQELAVGGADAAILSWSFWQDEFGGDEATLGQSLDIGGRPHRIVGVMPRGFTDPLYPTAPLVWIPLRIDQTEALPRGGRRGDRAFLRVFARLAPGVSLVETNERLGLFSAALAERFVENRDRTLRAVPLVDDVVEDHRSTFWALFVAVTLVLGIACSNVGSLLLGQAVRRRGDVALRRALGASRGAMARLFLTESVLLALLGGAFGVLLAAGTMPLAARWASQSFALPTYNPIDLDLRAMIFAFTATLVSGLLFGAVPLRQALRTRASDMTALRTASSRSANRVRRSIVVGELALSVILLVAAGLVVRSLVALAAVPPGFSPESAVLLRTSARGPFEAPERRAQFAERVRDALLSVPGVESVGAASVPPIFDGGLPAMLDLGDATNPTIEPAANLFLTGPGLFEALGTPILQGRDFQPQDDLDSAPVALVSAAFVDRFLDQNVDPIGMTVRFTDGQEARTVIGVVGDIRRPGVRPQPVPMLYMPLAQSPRESISFVIRGAADPADLLAASERAVKQLSPESPVYNMDSLSNATAAMTGPQSVLASLFVAFSTVALVLACIGTYALFNQSVLDRRREFGIRAAFGARRVDLRSLVRREATGLGLLGIAVGLVLAAALSFGLRSQLYGIGTLDPLTYLAVSATLLLVVVLATVVPAHRAARAEPARTLRE